MLKSIKYLDISYSESDLEYISEIAEFLDKNTDEIVSFFEITDFGEKIHLTLYNDLNTFRTDTQRITNKVFPDWFCGLSYSNCIMVLSLSEYVKTKGHEKHTLNDLERLILHEFVHSCHRRVSKINCAWLAEGLACTLSHQYDKARLVINASLEDILSKTVDYKNYNTLLRFAYTTYGKEYILKLIHDNKFLIAETPKLYKEAVIFLSNK